MRRDTKMILTKDKGILMEPFRKKKLYEFKDQEIKKIPINDDIVALDAMVVSEDHNMLLVIVDKRSRDDLVKYL